jgi:probable rRNA maturation factor
LIEVHVNVPGGEDVPAGVLRRAVEVTLRGEGCEAAEVSVTLLDDGAIRTLNREYLGRDGVTDVIAFRLDPEDDALLGDVYIGLDQAVRQAEEEDVAREEELVRLAIHGTLHLLGWDHPEGPERLDSPQFVRQEELVREVVREVVRGAAPAAEDG